MYCGHMFEAGLADEAVLAAEIDRLLDRLKVGVAYGALARGSDILLAERLLASGAELNVVLPFQTEDFVRASVGEGSWRERFDACLAAAWTVGFASETAFVNDPLQFRFGANVAMGLVRLRSDQLGGTPVQIAVWDGRPASNLVAGTAVDIEIWRQSEGRTEVLAPGSLRRGTSASVPPRTPPEADRAIMSIVFTDFAGFSKLSEAALPRFWRQVMKRCAEVLDRHPEVVCRNSWGDAVYAVVETPAAAATLALELHEALAEVDLGALGIQAEGGMRVGVHLGPVYRDHDYVTGVTNYFGAEVSRTARIEPITPPGAVYVTEAFAAALVLQAPRGFTCAYVGRLELPKRFGSQRLYRLARALA
jgi:class 3 adenylate cyclase